MSSVNRTGVVRTFRSAVTGRPEGLHYIEMKTSGTLELCSKVDAQKVGMWGQGGQTRRESARTCVTCSNAQTTIVPTSSDLP